MSKPDLNDSVATLPCAMAEPPVSSIGGDLALLAI
jgi:hypothetical protein